MKRIVLLIAVIFSASALAPAAGPASVTDFGQVAIGSTSSQAVTIPLTPAQVTAAQQCAVHYGVDFSASTCSLTANGVRLSITFQPKYAGLRQDAVIVEDGAGNLIAEAFLHGIGNGPMAAFRPGVIRQLLPYSGPNYVNYSPWGIVADRESGVAYVAERTQSVVWQIKPDGTRAIYAGIVNPEISNSGDGGPATAAAMVPQAMALDPAGNLFIVSAGSVVRRVDSVTGIITTFAGGGSDSNGDGGPATEANLQGTVSGLAVDAVGNLYLAMGTIRKVDAVTGIITTIAGSTTAVQYGDGGPATQAALGAAEIAFDAVGNLYATCPTPAATIRRIDAQTGLISTVAGIPYHITEGPDQDGVAATSVALYSPSGLVVDAAGDIYFGNNQHIRKVSAATGLVTSLNDGDASVFTVFAGEWTSLTGYPGNAPVENGFFGMDGAGNLFTSNMEIERDEGTLFFGQTSIGQTSTTQAFTIENIGNQTMQVASAQVSANFTSSGSCGGPMAAGQECSLSIAFNPGQTGGISGDVTVDDNSLNQTGAQQVSALRGPWAQAIPFETVADFGATVNALSGSSPFSFEMQNPGDIPIHLKTVVSGPNASEFSFLNDNCGLGGTGMIAAQQTCYSWIMFEPVTAGPKTMTLTITNDYDSTVQTITVQGTALPPLLPQISFSQNGINFSGPQWQSGGVQTLTVTNTGTAPLSFSQIALQNPVDPDLTVFWGSCVEPFLFVQQSCQFAVSFSPVNKTPDTNALVITDNVSNSPQTIPITASFTQTPLQFVPVTPCRIADTRIGSTPMPAQSSRPFAISDAACGVPSTAAAYSLNVTAIPAGGLGYLSVAPLGTPLPLASTLNSDGRVKANAAIVAAGGGGVDVYVSDKSDVVLDIDGYFAPAATTNNAGLLFYPVTPCRIADTRNGNGPFGGPALSAGISRTIPILSSSCNLPAGAQAYSLNFTAIPHTWLGFLSTWPTGQTQPVVSTLNSPGDVTANAALVPAGTDGSIDVYASNDADLVIDVDGYFAPPGTGGLSFYSLPPCRTVDTRLAGSGAPFNGTITEAVTQTCGVPATANAVALNATVVPTGPLWYLTLWPDGSAIPISSTLNSDSGAVTSNMAIVTTINGSIDAFGTNPTQIILDISGYFAP